METALLYGVFLNRFFFILYILLVFFLHKRLYIYNMISCILFTLTFLSLTLTCRVGDDTLAEESVADFISRENLKLVRCLRFEVVNCDTRHIVRMDSDGSPVDLVSLALALGSIPENVALFVATVKAGQPAHRCRARCRVHCNIRRRMGCRTFDEQQTRCHQRGHFVLENALIPTVVFFLNAFQR